MLRNMLKKKRRVALGNSEACSSELKDQVRRSLVYFVWKPGFDLRHVRQVIPRHVVTVGMKLHFLIVSRNAFRLFAFTRIPLQWAA